MNKTSYYGGFWVILAHNLEKGKRGVIREGPINTKKVVMCLVEERMY